VGTLFGKTLDVDMAYTRKNKVLRIKIGCLDHRLIPADSDMFIRRGFYKLRFEVEIEDRSQEINMVDANNGSDGNNGPNQGEGKHGDDQDMDMDNKEKDTDEASKGDDQHGSSSHNGVDGMQEQCDVLPTIQFGTMEVQGGSPGNSNAAENLHQKELVYISKFNSVCSALDDEVRAISHADLLHREASPGLVGVGIGEVGQQSAIGQVLPIAALSQPAAIGRPSSGRQRLSADVWSPCTVSRAAGGSAAGDRGLHAAACTRSGPGSSVQAKGVSPAAAEVLQPQKITPAVVSNAERCTTVKIPLGPMIGSNPGGFGSPVPSNAVVQGDGDMPIGGGSPVPVAMKIEAWVDRQSPKRLGPKATGP
jgi:hypothetical protein